MDEQQQQISMADMMGIVNQAWNRYVLENSELMASISHLLLGEIQKPVEKEIEGERVIVMDWVKPNIDDKPPINDKGYYFTMLHVTQALDKSQATGNLSEEQAMTSINQVMKGLTNVYAIKFKEFGFETPAEAQTLIISIMNLLKTHLTKSIGMKLITQLASSYNVTEHKVSGVEEQQNNMNM